MSEPNNPGVPSGGKDNEREVTDPVTHLPLTIHDVTDVELEQIPPPDELEFGSITEKKPKKQDEQKMKEESNQRHVGVEKTLHDVTHRGWWRDPAGDQDRARIQTAFVAAGASGVGAFGAWVVWWLAEKLTGGRRGNGSTTLWTLLDIFLVPFGCSVLAICVGMAALSFKLVQPEAKTQEGEDRKRADHAPKSKKPQDEQSSPESAQWLNALLTSLWPTVNPALFTSISDMLEDALQSTLPKAVNGVRVADIGQGSLPVRVLGVRWLAPGLGGEDRDGMQGEEGDFVNLEIALGYRARTGGTAKGLRGRSGNAHLLMEFYAAGGIVLPVWVELTGFLCTMRTRIQLTPNPPFLSLMTLTLLGQPKVTMNCTPLAKNFLNVMDLPVLSGWLQSAVDAAVAEYVAPRSMNLDLKAILMGEEKRDTDAWGVVILTVRRATDFRMGDGGKIWKVSEGAKMGDTYVTAGWSKWGKPLWSTRIIQKDGKPVWEETTALLVGPAEVHAKESVRLQLWDSDRFTADDLLGNIDLSLKELLTSAEFKNTIATRTDDLFSDTGKKLPGSLEWEVGYFAKTTLEQHLKDKKEDPEELKQKISKEAEEKLREAKTPGSQESDEEIQQQKKEDLKEKTDEIITSSPPVAEWPSGILSVRIEQISGLEVERIRESGVKGGQLGEEMEGQEEDSDDGDLPSAYCTIVINHQRVYKTRTKMKSGDPYFDAGTEKFIRDWRTTTVIISVRDSRLHEANPLLGVVVLPLTSLFKHASQFSGSLPLVGGIGYGRMRLSLTFRSVQAKLPKRLLGWDNCTVEITGAKADNLPQELRSCRLVWRTNNGKGRMVPYDGDESGPRWHGKGERPACLPVTKRYAECLTVQMRKRVVGPDHTPAYATIWLKDIPDDEELNLTVPLWRNKKDDGGITRAQANAIGDEEELEGEGGEQVGTLDITLRIHPGLSGYHKKMASHDKGMADVMEVLDCAQAAQEGKSGIVGVDLGGDSASSSDSSTDTEADDGEGAEVKKLTFKEEVKGYKKRKGELHRKHRGLMQWSGMRNIAHLGQGVEHKAEQLGDKLKGTFKHEERQTGIEKEA
ncbi:hypothetical protein BDQ12DRAFT_690365 [Crucibulum laeve]|uniref:C2 domain-containing protein n=1 Tax=Crucibulum laeve TaxID=68775 RepID=A0A5C3LMM6_9AGAR|nr:hypothetical protein BDQ12DRAFT_690365 [Crucibulum laeve]